MERATESDVKVFKEKWCNENELITKLINSELQNHFKPPILDVGDGIGDIAYLSFKEKEVTGIDINYIPNNEYPLQPKHTRIRMDFFDFVPNRQYNTVLMSHVMQYLDDDLHKLEERIGLIGASNLVLILNANDGIMGKIVDWVLNSFEKSNPEVRIPNFPRNYDLKEKKHFSALLKCDSFDQLALQVSYLMLINIENREQEVIDFLKKNLKKPEFTINQDILIYERR